MMSNLDCRVTAFEDRHVVEWIYCLFDRFKGVAMTTISLQEAQAKLSSLVHQLSPGDEVLITENNQPVARLVPAAVTLPIRKLGTMRGSVHHMASDFDSPLNDFREYMQ
jgi:prevent-host-death family protein